MHCASAFSELYAKQKKKFSWSYLVNFEFYINIPNLEVLFAEDLDFIETKTMDIALSSFSTYNNNVPHYLSNGKPDALKNLSQNKHILIQKSNSFSWQKQAY